MSTPQLVGLWGVFLLGLTGGFGHCLTMCGPVISAVSLAHGCNRMPQGSTTIGSGTSVPVSSALWFQVAYHAGRLTTYVLLGAVLGLLGQATALTTLGRTFSPDHVTRWLQVGAGFVLIATGALLVTTSLGVSGARLFEPTAIVANRPWFARAVAWLTERRRWTFLLGMLMGLLPCMPLLPVELAALSTGYPLYGAITMLVFGLGTLPALAGFGALAGVLGARARMRFAAGSGAIVIVLGTLSVWQGLSLASTL